MRPELDNLGNYKPLREGAWELRVDVGVGYRTYYAGAGAIAVLPLRGGDKWKQNADIDRAYAYWCDWQNQAGD